MVVKSFTNSLLESMSYIITLGKTAWLVDPGDGEPLINDIERYRLNLQGILLTHGHFDHIYGLNDVVASFPTVPVYTNEFGAKMLVSAKLNLSKYHEMPFEFQYPENIVVLGSDLEIGPFQVYETPGHNPSCLTLVADEVVFTGDAYIPGIAVVTNLPKGNKELAQQSVQKILDLAIGKTIYPGHKMP